MSRYGNGHRPTEGETKMTSKEMLALMNEKPDADRYFENVAPLGHKPRWVVKYYSQQKEAAA